MERGTLRKLLVEIAQNGKSARYPAELREAAVEYLRAQMATGRDLRDVAREIGMVPGTLQRWDGLHPAPAPAPAAMEAVGTTKEDGEAPNANDDVGTMEDRARRLRARVAEANIIPGRGYPKELRIEALGYCEARQAEGATGTAIAQELGVSWDTLNRWQSNKPSRARGRLRSTPDGFRRVVVADGETPSAKSMGTAIVVHAGSIRVEGLNVAGLAELLRRLG